MSLKSMEGKVKRDSFLKLKTPVYILNFTFLDQK